MLIVLLIVGLLMLKQMGSSSRQQTQEAQAVSGSDVPRVPTNPNDVKKFGVQMNEYMNKEAAKRAAAMEDATSK
jgi:hypothetical protein